MEQTQNSKYSTNFIAAALIVAFLAVTAIVLAIVYLNSARNSTSKNEEKTNQSTSSATKAPGSSQTPTSGSQQAKTTTPIPTTGTRTTAKQNTEFTIKVGSEVVVDGLSLNLIVTQKGDAETADVAIVQATYQGQMTNLGFAVGGEGTAAEQEENRAANVYGFNIYTKSITASAATFRVKKL